MNFPRVPVVLLGFLLSAVPDGWAGNPDVGTTGAAFLKIGNHARPAGLADSFVALADGVSGLAWNPAGLMHITSLEGTVTYGLWFGDLRYHYLAVARPFGPHRLGIQVTYLSAGTFQGYGVDNEGNPQEEASFGVSDVSGAVSYAIQPFAPALFGIGITARYIGQQVSDVSATGLSCDVGMLWQSEDGVVSVGVAMVNIGPEYAFGSSTLKLPLQAKLGLAIHGSEMVTVVAGLDVPSDHSMRAHGGAEVWIEKSVALRAGYSTRLGDSDYAGSLQGWTAGLGVRVQGFGLDYAFVPFGTLGFTHRVSLGFQFGASSEEE